MPSLAIHLAIAKRYTELHLDEVSSFDEFQKGSIAPDLSNDFSRILSRSEKAITHYYDQPGKYITNFDLFKQDKKLDLTSDYWRGYYVHLLADYLFKTTFFKREIDRSFKDGISLYDDFTLLTSKIIEDYQLETDSAFMTDVIKQCLTTMDGECRYLDYAKVRNFIDKVAKDLDRAIQDML